MSSAFENQLIIVLRSIDKSLKKIAGRDVESDNAVAIAPGKDKNPAPKKGISQLGEELG